MPYKYIGSKSLYEGRPLFKILCHLKDFGQNRIVYRTFDYYKYPGEIHFYRILKAQPEMDEKTLQGRVLVEKVFRGYRYQEPCNVSEEVYKPDFRLVPKREEAQFCQWDKVVDYDIQKHAPYKPEFIDMPPLLKEVIRRNKLARGESVSEDFRLPAYKIYQGDHNITKGEVESNLLSEHISAEYATHKDFDPALIPGEWNYERYNMFVGHRKWSGYVEGEGWEEHLAKDEAEKSYLAQLRTAEKMSEQGQ
eukprot:snap_masked-scaffold1570_size35393-processed-gene-0.8 protein:Tk03606 transcript:snap_masked-scaffold1570_size35393-processed-gene-0.8-mRNA-1 annotation:"28s ribosomal protein mitochondrial"